MDVQDFQIPLKLKLKVEMDPSAGISGNKLKDTIKETLVNTFSPYMGVQKSFDRSEILTVVRDIAGVQYAELLSPEIDINFKYAVSSNEQGFFGKELTQEQLVDYTPQYVGFTEDTIEIDIQT